MPVSEEYRAFVEELLEPLGAVRSRRMFGGLGLFRHDLMFALVADEVIYFKVDAENLNRFETAGGRPFVYAGKERATRMSYWTLPDEELEEPERLLSWAQEGYAAALRAASKKKPARKKKS